MVYLYIIVLVGIAFLILERQRFFGKKEDSNTLESNGASSSGQMIENKSENKPAKKGFFDGIFSGNYFARDEFKNENSVNMTRCESCGNYFEQNQMVTKDNRYFCKNCANKI